MSRGSAAGAADRAQRSHPEQPDEPSAPAHPVLVEPWPHGVSREPTMRISDVLGDLRADFPTVTPSKLRFLEEQGLVEPRRSPGGYRQYSPADVERIRYVLRQQRDRYLPLRVIGEQLAELDSGRSAETVGPRLATRDGERAGSAGRARFTVEQLAEEAGADVAFVRSLVEGGVLGASATGHLDAWAREVVVTAAALAEHGVDVRHLRSFRGAADRQVSVVDQIVAPLRSQRALTAQAQAATLAAEVGELCGRLHTALVRSGVAGLAP